MEVSKTTNRLHFEDLDPMRFEDLCFGLIYPLHPWLEIHHIGRSGSDGGVDISAIEQLENNQTRDWIIQCRRYSKASKSTLEKAVDDSLKECTNPPEVLLVIVASNVSRKALEAYKKYAIKQGVNTPLLWDSSNIEAKLYSEQKDLLNIYFGTSNTTRTKQKEINIKKTIALKKRLQRELIKKTNRIPREVLSTKPYKKFICDSMIIRDIDNDSYLNKSNDNSDKSGWSKNFVWDFYHNGLEFFFPRRAIIDKHGNWALIDYNEEIDDNKYTRIDLLELGQIPYSNIVEIDLQGDEDYSQPHLYCSFSNNGSPCEGHRWIKAHSEYPREMDDELRFEYYMK